MHANKVIYTIQKNHDILSVQQSSTRYYIGFNKSQTARKVQYSIHPEPQITLMRGTRTHVDEVYFEFDASLFIPKCVGSTLLPMNDGCFHMNMLSEKEFLLLPTKRCGIIIPYELSVEDDDEFVFKTFVIEPIPTIPY